MLVNILFFHVRFINQVFLAFASKLYTATPTLTSFVAAGFLTLGSPITICWFAAMALKSEIVTRAGTGVVPATPRVNLQVMSLLALFPTKADPDAWQGKSAPVV
jgi:hypothetical protein